MPKRATIEIQDKLFVYKVENNIAKQEGIEVAANSTTESYIVTRGLENGCEIVVEGVALIHDGDIVKRGSVKEAK